MKANGKCRMRPSAISEQDKETSRYNRPGRKRFTRKRLCFLLVPALAILMAILFFALSKYHAPDFNEVLARAKLAKLPESVKNLDVDTRPVMAGGRTVPGLYDLLIKFQAEPNDIDNFIADSPGIDKNSCRPLIPLPAGDDVPTWWPTDQSTSGRMYTSPERKDTYGAAVFVYDDSNTARISVCYIAHPQMRDAQRFLEDVKDNSEEFVEDLIHEVGDVLGD